MYHHTSLLLSTIALTLLRSSIATPFSSIFNQAAANATRLQLPPTIDTNPLLADDPQTWPVLNSDYKIPGNLYITMHEYSTPPPTIYKLSVLEALFQIDHQIRIRPVGPLPTSISFSSGPVHVAFSVVLSTEELPTLTRAQATAILFVL